MLDSSVLIIAIPMAWPRLLHKPTHINENRCFCSQVMLSMHSAAAAKNLH